MPRRFLFFARVHLLDVSRHLLLLLCAPLSSSLFSLSAADTLRLSAHSSGQGNQSLRLVSFLSLFLSSFQLVQGCWRVWHGYTMSARAVVCVCACDAVRAFQLKHKKLKNEPLPRPRRAGLESGEISDVQKRWDSKVAHAVTLQ